MNSGDKGVGKKKRKKKMRERMARQEKVARAIALPFYDRLSVRCGLPFPYLSIFLPVHFGGGCRFVIVVVVAFFVFRFLSVVVCNRSRSVDRGVSVPETVCP